MEALAGPLVAAIIGGVTLIMTMNARHDSASRSDLTSIREELKDHRERLIACEMAREALINENLTLMKRLLAIQASS